MRGQARSILIAGLALLSIFLLLGLTYESTNPSRIETSSAMESHELTFIQEGTPSPLGPVGWLPWSVTLSNIAIGNLTESNPTNTKILQCPSGGISFSNQSVSTITFLVPYGSYHYEADTALGPVSGQIDFSPSNALPVEVVPAASCNTN
jgi:hypothetical protein